MLQSQRQVIGRHDVPNIGGRIGSDNTHCRREDDQEWHDGEQTENLWQNEVAGRVDAHDVKGINLLCYPHGAELRCDV